MFLVWMLRLWVVKVYNFEYANDVTSTQEFAVIYFSLWMKPVIDMYDKILEAYVNDIPNILYNIAV